MKNIPWFTRFYTSQVVQDFFHQQCIPTFSSFWLNFILTSMNLPPAPKIMVVLEKKSSGNWFLILAAFSVIWIVHSPMGKANMLDAHVDQNWWKKSNEINSPLISIGFMNQATVNHLGCGTGRGARGRLPTGWFRARKYGDVWRLGLTFQVSNVKNPGWLGGIRASYKGSIINLMNHYEL